MIILMIFDPDRARSFELVADIAMRPLPDDGALAWVRGGRR
jgi:hypothetical protein